MSSRAMVNKFRVAFSFAGEQRNLVREIAEAVERQLGPSSVFLDEWFEFYIAGDDADLKLRRIYGERCDLVVVCVSEPYGARPWTHIEHAAVRARMMKASVSISEGDRAAVLPIRVGDGDIRDLLFNTVVPDVRHRPVTETCQLILDRLRETAASPPGPSAVVAEQELGAYRTWVADRTSGLELVGVAGGDLKLGFDEVYVPLRLAAVDHAEPLEPSSGSMRAEHWRGHLAQEIELENVFSPQESSGSHSPHVLLFGEPGAGKTTALRKLANVCATSGPECLGLAAGTVPIMLRLRRLRERDLSESMGSMIQREFFEADRTSSLAHDLGERLWRRGRLLLLFDGLDEIGDDVFSARVCGWLDGILRQHGDRQVRVAISCRNSGWTQRVRDVHLELHFTSLYIRPLDREQVLRLVRNWFRAAARNPGNGPSGQDVIGRGEILIADLEGKAYSSQRLKVLVSSPLMLTLLCVVVFRGGEMPLRRAAFYDQCLRVLLGQWTRSKDLDSPLDVDCLLSLLHPIAYDLHRQQRRDDYSGAELLRAIEQGLHSLRNAPRSGVLRDWLHRTAGVLAEYGAGRWGFVQLGLQEYLAALHVASRGEGLLDDLVAHAADEWWREVVLLLVGLPQARMFGAVASRLVAAAEPNLDLLRACVEETVEADVAPLLAYLKPDGDPARQELVLGLLRGRKDPALMAAAVRLQTAGDHEVRIMATLLLEDASVEEAGERRRRYDLCLVAGDDDRARADRLLRTLQQRIRVWPEVLGPSPVWQARLDEILEEVRAVAILAGPSPGGPWQNSAVAAFLELMADRSRAVLVLTASPVQRPAHLPTILGGAETRWLELGTDETQWIQVVSSQLVGVSGSVAKTRLGLRMASGQPYIEPTTGTRLLWIPGGRSRMGGSANPEAQPQHWVTLTDFLLAETPVTNAQYRAFMQETGSREPDYWRDRRFSAPAQPVVGVGWEDARAYCRWLSHVAEMAVALPSEAQWEYAARGTEGREYPWGSERPDARRACFGMDPRNGRPSAVGSYPAGRGPFDTLDQAGNVWEWCLDGWDTDAHERRALTDSVNPVVRAPESHGHPVRGGAWLGPPAALRAASRFRGRPGDRGSAVGFRVAVTPDSTAR